MKSSQDKASAQVLFCRADGAARSTPRDPDFSEGGQPLPYPSTPIAARKSPGHCRWPSRRRLAGGRAPWPSPVQQDLVNRRAQNTHLAGRGFVGGRGGRGRVVDGDLVEEAGHGLGGRCGRRRRCTTAKSRRQARSGAGTGPASRGGRGAHQVAQKFSSTTWPSVGGQRHLGAVRALAKGAPRGRAGARRRTVILRMSPSRRASSPRGSAAADTVRAAFATAASANICDPCPHPCEGSQASGGLSCPIPPTGPTPCGAAGFPRRPTRSWRRSNASISFDQRLAAQDIAGSRAHAAECSRRVGLLSDRDAEAIRGKGCSRSCRKLKRGQCAVLGGAGGHPHERGGAADGADRGACEAACTRLGRANDRWRRISGCGCASAATRREGAAGGALAAAGGAGGGGGGLGDAGGSRTCRARPAGDLGPSHDGLCWRCSGGGGGGGGCGISRG